ncbi:hypothetical protein [Methanobacterium sp. SMA-27]|uniref:hypothetical protein n=1 Tax=Methanobacterium sp. SMA-27 TaxID=1495336 RepID=UPI00064F6A5F|nr:hypothetical protein [Methanobacterium sp. SMA-27]
MEIITMIKGKIDETVSQDFEDAYAAIKEEGITDGLVASYLLKDLVVPDLYKIESVWVNEDILKNMMDNDETSTEVKLFEKFGVDPTVEVYEVRDSFSQFEE